MIHKKCAYCGGVSYSAYDDPKWECPYCHKHIGNEKNVLVMDKKRQNKKADLVRTGQQEE